MKILFLLLVLVSCSSLDSHEEATFFKVKYYSVFMNRTHEPKECKETNEMEKLAWQRSKKISCKTNIVYISCNYPNCDKEDFHCLDQDDLSRLCENYPAININLINN